MSVVESLSLIVGEGFGIDNFPRIESCRAHRPVEKGRFAMVILKKETGAFASASEKLLSLISNTALPQEDRSVVDYYIREIEQGLDLSYPAEKSC